MLIKVKVWPGFKEDQIVQKKQDSFEIWVKAKPIQGQANQAVISLLADTLSVPRENIKLIKGFRERNKVFQIK